MTKSVTSEKIYLPNVRLSFARLFEAKAFQEGQAPRYEAAFLLDPSDKKHTRKIKEIQRQSDAIIAERWGKKGVIIRDLDAGSAAARAGLQSIRVDRWGNVASYDRIVGIDDESIEDFNDLYSALDGREAGERVEVHFVSRGEKRSAPPMLQEIE